MATITDYEVIQEDTAAALTVSVQAAIVGTWQPFGAVSVCVGWDNGQLPRHQKFTQAVVKYAA